MFKEKKRALCILFLTLSINGSNSGDKCKSFFSQYLMAYHFVLSHQSQRDTDVPGIC